MIQLVMEKWQWTAFGTTVGGFDFTRAHRTQCVLFVALQGFQGKTGPPGPGGVVGPQVH